MCDEGIDQLKYRVDEINSKIDKETEVAKQLELINQRSILLHKIQARKDRSRHFTSSMLEYYFHYLIN